MDEVPRLQPLLRSLDQQQALAAEHEEVLLLVLAVIHARGLTGLENADVEPQLGEALISLEAGVGAELAVEPARVAHVEDEPARSSRGKPALSGLKRSLGNHARDYAQRYESARSGVGDRCAAGRATTTDPVPLLSPRLGPWWSHSAHTGTRPGLRRRGWVRGGR